MAFIGISLGRTVFIVTSICCWGNPAYTQKHGAFKLYSDLEWDIPMSEITFLSLVFLCNSWGYDARFSTSYYDLSAFLKLRQNSV